MLLKKTIHMNGILKAAANSTKNQGKIVYADLGTVHMATGGLLSCLLSYILKYNPVSS
jgi:hypothetical protein